MKKFIICIKNKNTELFSIDMFYTDDKFIVYFRIGYLYKTLGEFKEYVGEEYYNKFIKTIEKYIK